MGGTNYGHSTSPRREVRPDSTSTVDPEQKPRPAFNSSVKDPEHSNSPQRISLDERLERELGLKVERMEKMEALQLATGLPATIPTYDSIPGLDPSPLPKTPSVPVEKEQAIVAAAMVTTKLLEMQAAKEAERQRRKEARMAERLAGMVGEQGMLVEQQKVATGRILEQVEQQEQATEELKVKNKKRTDTTSTPTLITLKPFYRPHEKKGRKKRPETPPEEDWEEYSDVPRSPVPLPDNSVCKPVLVKLGFGVSKEARKSKSVKYRDGMLPGQGSPDRSAPRSPKPIPALPVVSVKKYKKVRVVVITQQETGEEVDTRPPPPPPPGSPPRYSTSELIAKYCQPVLIKTSA
jgi:hypothetical protein